MEPKTKRRKSGTASDSRGNGEQSEEASHRTLAQLSDGIFTKLLVAESPHHIERFARFRAMREFFRFGEEKRYRSKPKYRLPDGFADWVEWQSVVISKLKAMARLDISYGERNPFSNGDDLDEIAFSKLTLERFGMVGGFDSGIERCDWDQIFYALQKNGKVLFAEALSLFRGIDGMRDNFPVRTQPFPLRKLLIIREWVHFDPEPGKVVGLCTLTNDSAADVVNQLESNSNGVGLTGNNFSREKAKLGLVSCRNRSRRMTAS